MLLPIDIETLSPIQRMELADALYDSAMQQLELAESALGTEQLEELDRRIDALHAGESTLVPWDEVYGRLTAGRRA